MGTLPGSVSALPGTDVPVRRLEKLPNTKLNAKTLARLLAGDRCPEFRHHHRAADVWGKAEVSSRNAAVEQLPRVPLSADQRPPAVVPRETSLPVCRHTFRTARRTRRSTLEVTSSPSNLPLLTPRTLYLRLPDESRDAPIAARRQARIGIITVTKLRWVVGWPKTDSKFRRFFVMHRPAHLNRRNPGPPTACRWVHMPTPKPTTSEVPDANLRSKRASRSRVVRSRRPRWKCGAAEVAELAAAKLNRPERLPLAGTANRRRSGPRPARTWHQYFVEPRPRTSLGRTDYSAVPVQAEFAKSAFADAQQSRARAVGGHQFLQ